MLSLVAGVLLLILYEVGVKSDIEVIKNFLSNPISAGVCLSLVGLPISAPLGLMNRFLKRK